MAVEGPGEGGFAVGPVVVGLIGEPFGDERGFAFAAEGDEGEDVGAFWFAFGRF